MKKLKSHEVEEVLQYVLKCIMNGYEYNLDDSNKMLKEYDFKNKLINNTDYILHYNLEYWAEEIVKQSKVNLER
jgi:uncharacterized protein YihD (DUF1040 family)